MKKLNLTAFLLALCLLLSACMTLPGGNDTPVQNDPPTSNEQTDLPPDEGNEFPPEQDQTTDNKKDDSTPAYPADLNVELVVEWAMADTILSLLDDLSELLRDAVKEAGCQLDSVTLTISTAGAYTANSLVDGGVDAAILPSVDIVPFEKRVAILALSDDEIPRTAIAVSLAGSDLSEDFRAVLLSALTQTQAGQDFISACCGEAVFSAPSEETLQAVRDYLREINEEGGHE
ncbi:MAG: hypothetical protein IKM11_01745 [Oscillospiraceae bacterium]|nr:hypothetical protein [Oscillospiraceae bacterium]